MGVEKKLSFLTSPLYSLLTIMKKDLLLFLKHRGSTFLIVLTPILIVGIIGATVSDQPYLERDTKTIHLLLCDKDESDLSRQYGEQLENFFHVSRMGADCEEASREAIKQGYFKVALIVPQGFASNINQGKTSVLLTYYDNTDAQVSELSKTILLASVHSLSKELGKQFISNIWGELGKMELEVQDAQAQINVSRQDLLDLRQDTVVFKQTLDEISWDDYVSDLEEGADLAKKAVEVIDLLTFAQENTSLSALKQNTSFLRDSLAYLKENSSNQSIRIHEASRMVWEASVALEILADALEGNESQFAQQISQNVSLTSYLLRNVSESLNNSSKKLEELENHTLAILSALENSSDTLLELRQNISLEETRLRKTSEKISGLKNTSENMSESLGETIILIDGYLEKLEELEEKTGETKEQLSLITKTAPENILSPAYLSTEKVFPEVKKIDPILPSILAMVIMFVSLLLTSTSLVRERQSGTLERSLTSPTPSVFFLLSKLASVTLICMVESIILLSFSYAFFGTRVPPNSLLDLLFTVSLLAFTFSSIGLVIATVAKSETVAVLSSLIISIPMLFLSGMFIPLELMDPSVKELAALMPFSQGIMTLKRILIFETGNPYVFPLVTQDTLLLLPSVSIYVFYLTFGLLVSWAIFTKKTRFLHRIFGL